MKKICVVTSTRAEYGVIKRTLREIERHPLMELCLIVTGTHLLREHGNTIDEIRKDGFSISKTVFLDMSSDSSADKVRTMGEASIKFSEVFEQVDPDLLLVTGDRYEILSIATAAYMMGIPIAHISGGEVTEGALDDNIRHCLTKISSLHFPGCEAYRQRIIQLGEHPDTVFNYGDVGVENIVKMDFLSLAELEDDLKIPLKDYICLTYHPVTTQLNDEKEQVQALLDAISQFTHITFIITKANSDAGGEYINKELEKYCESHSNCHLFSSLGSLRYISLIKSARAVVGNSSSGIIEAPVLKVPVVNIGDRQKGRLQSACITDCQPNKDSITAAIKFALSEKGLQKAKESDSLYKSDDTSIKIVEAISHFLESGSHTAKSFYDIDFTPIK